MGSTTADEHLKTVLRPDASDRKERQHHEATLYQIANRALSDNAAAQVESYFEIVARATNDAVRDLDLTGKTITWPYGLRELFGYENAGPTDVAFWTDRIHPDDRARIDISIRGALYSQADRWSDEYRFRHSDGSYLQLLERATIFRDANQRPVRLIGSLMDITARKQLHDQLCRSQKMEAFGQLAGGAAHDFNNYLTTILGYSDLLLSQIGGKGMVAAHVAEIRKAAVRASNLTAQLLAFSRKQALEPRVFEVNALITNLERTMLRLLGDNIAVSCHLHHEKSGGHIRVDSGQFTQIILNLAVNARDAMPNGGELVLETAIVTVPQNGAPNPGGSEDLAPGEYVVIRVLDNGTGMTDEVKAHLFEPFFTTKSEAAATGLGLATCYGIIKQSGGCITIESEFGAGTKVEIYLPRAVVAPAYRKPASKKLPVGTETILVLEDDISVRHISVRVLRSLGYQVIEAGSGDDAQRLISARGGCGVDLLLTDVVMPQMSGRHFADWLRKVSPQTKIVFVSGYLDESHQAGNQSGVFFLPKPFDPEQLAQAIRQALDS